jgi:hypothetical protein
MKLRRKQNITKDAYSRVTPEFRKAFCLAKGLDSGLDVPTALLILFLLLYSTVYSIT